MVANISTGNDVYGVLAYNQQKVDKGTGAVLATHIIREPTDGRCSVAETANHPTDEQFADSAQKYMEYGTPQISGKVSAKPIPSSCIGSNTNK